MHMPTAELATLNGSSPDAAGEALRRCCASSNWVSWMLEGRPYADIAAMQDRSDVVFARLGPDDLEEAMAAHPRIGERVIGTDAEAAWSRREQSGVASEDRGVEGALRAGNIEYESRFGHVFLIFASGRSATQMLAALEERMGNDRDTEWLVVAEELRKIARLRLQRLVST